MSDLVNAIDNALAFVRAHPDLMTRAEVDEFSTLAQRVFLLSVRAGLLQCLPQVPELRPELESQDPPLKPVQFITKLNLPGDFDDVVLDNDDGPLPQLTIQNVDDFPPLPEKDFLVCASPRWFTDMETLRKLAGQLAPPEPPAIWFHGGQSYSIDKRTPLSVPLELHTLLQLFLDKEGSLTYPELTDKGITNPSVAVNRIAAKFSTDAIQKPKGKGNGYFVRVRTLESSD